MTQSRPAGWWTIDELAAVAGTTSRNVRAFQSRALLPPPHLVGRSGRYDDGHRARLAALSAAWERGATLDDVLGFETAARAQGRRRRRSRREGDAEVIVLDELRQWRVPRGSALALLPGPVLGS
jgi:DNA-binding transcriptional MerR regulator